MTIVDARVNDLRDAVDVIDGDTGCFAATLRLVARGNSARRVQSWLDDLAEKACDVADAIGQANVAAYQGGGAPAAIEGLQHCRQQLQNLAASLSDLADACSESDFDCRHAAYFLSDGARSLANRVDQTVDAFEADTSAPAGSTRRDRRRIERARSALADLDAMLAAAPVD
ncbi:hypothetical protein AAFN88_08720 [Pelagibius sp. CAU 1746]|uniref:hypothetical protein n=1 Tax=Pelagibius sp. CAU 1746 TaxID=3140370 RepID=UPI00325AC150